jgi:hypothetical protein
MRLLAVALLCTTVQSVAAQSPDLQRAGVPSADARRIEQWLEDPTTRRHVGDLDVGRDEIVDGNLYVRRGVLRVFGLVNGNILVMDGDVWFDEGAEVTGDVTVVGGATRNSERARLAGTVTEYGEGFGLLARARAVHNGRDEWRGRNYGTYSWRDWDGGELAVRIGRNYNRVEGLPVQIGPSISTGGRWATRLEALAVWRTDAGPLTNTERMGYVARAEQFLGMRGGALRIGASLRSTIDPIEAWTVSDLEASLAAGLLHDDQRDYFERDGWSAYLRVMPRRSPFDVILEYRDERHRTVAPRTPWTLFDRGDPWRDQPLVAEGRIRTANVIAEIDDRRGGDFAYRGVYARAELTHALDGSLQLPQASLYPAGAITSFDSDFTIGLLDLRGYAPFGRHAALAMRVVGGGSLDAGSALAPQFQHALGGAGTLPGYPLMSVDCGARSTSILVPGDAALPTPFFTRYGCDRFALVQAEYRGGMDFHFGDWDRRGRDFNAGVDWTLFFDAARGWVIGSEPGRSDTQTLYDAGAGIILGGFGIYGAVPLEGDERGVRFFVRLGPRF